MEIFQKLKQACATQVQHQHDRGERIVTKTVDLASHSIKGVRFAAYTALGVFASSALAGLATVNGVYQTIRHPIDTANTIKRGFDKIMRDVEVYSKDKIQELEGKMIDSKFEGVQMRINALGPSISQEDKAAIIAGFRETLLEKQNQLAREIAQCPTVALPLQLTSAAVKVWWVGRYFNRCEKALDRVCNFIEKNGAEYPDGCSGLAKSYIEKVKDRRLTFFEALSLRAEITVKSFIISIGSCVTRAGDRVKKMGPDPAARAFRGTQDAPAAGA